jgi:hypothetical protein
MSISWEAELSQQIINSCKQQRKNTYVPGKIRNLKENGQCVWHLTSKKIPRLPLLVLTVLRIVSPTE